MYRQLLVLITLILWSAITLPLPKQASAETALNRAIVQSLRNLVRLMPQNRTARPARVTDAMTPGDALSTGRSSLAELRFNDGSLARIGEQAVFQFVRQTRNFKLSNGTVLLLIPPGQGKTGVWTPNAAAAIRGSALFVRYIPETATTVIGALTNSNIGVFTQGSSQPQVLQAGQLAVIVKEKIEGLYNFDLKTFYETSDLVRGLNLNKKSGAASSDPAIAQVQAETTAALAAQSPLTGAGVIDNPAFVRRPDNSQSQAQPNYQPNSTLQQDSQNPFSRNSSSITEFLENGEIILNQDNPQNLPTNNIPSAGGSFGGGSSNGTDQPNQGNNGIGGGVGGGGVNNIGNDNGDGSGIGGANNTGNGNDRGNNGIGGGVGGGGVNNIGNGNGNGNGNGGANNTGNNNRR